MTTATATDYETVIGLEVHAQLLTRSKMFCGCPADYANAEPNTHVCPVCMGMPGMLPVINRVAVEYTVMTALALNCEIPEHAKFDRKNYPYPDLMKGYQISQYDMPLSQNGYLIIDAGEGERRIGLERVHLEEDTARLLHRTHAATGETHTLVDINRAGSALMEIVSAPDIRSPEEAREYLMKLRQILRYIGVSNANMDEGNFRCDANISLRPRGETKLGAKVEVKNMNSFRSVAHALEFEQQRQRAALDAGERIEQQTRGWIEEQGITVPQRSKEQAHDYRYFPEPDLPPLVLTREWVESIRAKLPELPDAKRRRFAATYGISEYEAALLAETRARADYFEACVEPYRDDPARLAARAKASANWMLGEMARLQNAHNDDIDAIKVRPAHLRELLDLLDEGTISSKQAKDVFEKMYASGDSPAGIVEAAGLTQISGEDELAAVIAGVVAAHAQAVEDYRGGKQESLKFLVGQVMRATKGRANPELANKLLLRHLDGG